MNRTAAVRHAIDGVLLLDKPRGLTSQQAVSRAKRLFQARKAGHTGTLDPLADGLLPIGFGEATKFSQYLLDADKLYLATLRLGSVTATGDAEGEVTAERPVNVTLEQLQAVLQRFIGPITQIPPMYAAIKVDGKPLYAYARAGETVAREPRAVTIKKLQLIDFIDKTVKIRVLCSKGTYIRVLAEDIGNALDCGAHLTALTREGAGDFALERTITLDALEAMAPAERIGQLLAPDAFAAGLRRLDLGAGDEQRLTRGQQVSLGSSALPGLCRLYGAEGRFFGVGEVLAGTLVARRLLTQAQLPAGSQNSLSNPVVTG